MHYQRYNSIFLRFSIFSPTIETTYLHKNLNNNGIRPLVLDKCWVVT